MNVKADPLNEDGEIWIGSDVAPYQRNGFVTSNDESVTVSLGHGTIDLSVSIPEAATQIAAWVNSQNDGTINDSYNVDTVTHNSTGVYTISFSSSMADDDYGVLLTLHDSTGSLLGSCVESQSTSSVVINVFGGAINLLGYNLLLNQLVNPNNGFSIAIVRNI